MGAHNLYSHSSVLQIFLQTLSDYVQTKKTTQILLQDVIKCLFVMHVVVTPLYLHHVCMNVVLCVVYHVTSVDVFGRNASKECMET